MLLIVAGAALALLVMAEVLITVLHPEARGPVTAWLEHRIWRLIQWLNARASADVFRFGGPVALAAGVGWWVAGLWFGFGLIWLGAGDSVGIASSSAFDGGLGLVDALYLSGSVVTTTGFGDLIAASGATRLLAVAEGAMGLGVLSALISYVLSVYPLVTRKRAVASRLLDLGADEPDGAFRLAFGIGRPALERLHTELIQTDQDLRRFHVLYYFHASRYEEELTPLVRAAHLVLAALRLADPEHAPTEITAFAKPLRRASTRFREATARDFHIPELRESPRERCRRDLERLRAEAERRWGEWISADPPIDQILDEIAEGERYLAGLASVHNYEFTPLLAEG